MQRAAQLVGKRGTHLQGGSFTSSRGTEQVTGDGAEQHQRCHARGNHRFRIVNFIDEQVGATLDRATEVVINPSHGESGDRQQRDQPEMAFAHVRGPFE